MGKGNEKNEKEVEERYGQVLKGFILEREREIGLGVGYGSSIYIYIYENS